MSEDTRVVAKGMEVMGPVGVVAAAEAENTIGRRAGKKAMTQTQAERRTRNPLSGRIIEMLEMWEERTLQMRV